MKFSSKWLLRAIYIYICLLCVQGSRTPGSAKEAEQQIQDLLQQLLASIPNALGDSRVNLESFTSLEEALQICAISMASIFSPKAKIIGDHNTNTFYAFSSHSQSKNDDYLTSSMFKMEAYSNPEEYIPLITTNSYQVRKCVISDYTWIIMGQQSNIITPQSKESRLHEIVIFAELAFSFNSFESLWLSEDMDVYYVFSNEKDISQRKLMGSIQVFTEEEMEKERFHRNTLNKLHLSFSTILSIIKTSKFHHDLKGTLVAFRHQGASVIDTYRSVQDNEVDLFIDSLRVIGWAMGERHLQLRNSVSFIENELHITSLGVLELLKSLDISKEGWELNIRSLSSLFVKMEEMILKIPSLHDSQLCWVNLHEIPFITSHVYEYENSVFRIPQLPVYWNSMRHAALAPCCSEYYHTILTLKAIYPEIPLGSMILAAGAMNTTYHELFNSYHASEEEKIFYRFYNILNIVSTFDTREKLNALELILPEFILSEQSATPLREEDIRDIRAQIVRKSNRYSEFVSLLSNLSIWRFLQRDKDTFFLLDFLLE